jgi:hypothetical protein
LISAARCCRSSPTPVSAATVPTRASARRGCGSTRRRGSTARGMQSPSSSPAPPTKAS